MTCASAARCRRAPGIEPGSAAMRWTWIGSALLATTMLASPRAHAAEDEDCRDIVVTARRVDERAIDVPLNIAVVAAADMGGGAVTDLQTLAARVPGLTFEAIWGGANSFPIMRGQNQPSVAGDSVGMFVDGVYQANRDAIDVEPLDLQRIEVIFGPQSALFGHSTFAGLIHYVPASPSEEWMTQESADAGTDGLLRARATVSGPVDGTFKLRLAGSRSKSNGTWIDPAEPARRLGDRRSFALAGTLATRDDAGPLSVRLHGRYGESRGNQPAFASLDYRTNNCGGRDPASGVWSYYCGVAPVPEQANALSPGLQDSRAWAGQAALHLALDLGEVQLRSDTGWYAARSNAFRDFDGSASGEAYGVCVVVLNCPPVASGSASVFRVQQVNLVQRRDIAAREFTQELRLESATDRRLHWLVGAIAFWNRKRQILAYGAERGILAGSERFTSLVFANPARVGPLAAVNSALADDPNATQSVLSDFVERRRNLALFAAADWKIARRFSLRGELRANWEQVSIDSRLANFAPSFGKALPARSFFDLTPRLSAEFRPSGQWLVYASHARGSRSGGINATPNLIAEEQTFEPETNWTTELGVKYRGDGLLRSLQLTGFRIDWRNTQIVGLSISPGVNSLLTRNTRGVDSWGMEMAAQLQFRSWIGLDFAVGYTDPRFRQGSEDPGSTAFCGIAPGIPTSTFCTIRPSTIDPRQLVPDISGKVLLRAARWTWAGGLTLSPRGTAFHGATLRVGANHQDNVFDRSVNGAAYGRRTLLDARLVVPTSFGAIELWGTNLTGMRYFRSAAGRQPQFYSGQPRPLDLILGEGRRLGITLRFGG